MIDSQNDDLRLVCDGHNETAINEQTNVCRINRSHKLPTYSMYSLFETSLATESDGLGAAGRLAIASVRWPSIQHCSCLAAAIVAPASAISREQQRSVRLRFSVNTALRYVRDGQV